MARMTASSRAKRNDPSRSIKEQVAERLTKIEVVEGVLPTRAEKSKELYEVAANFDRGNLKEAERGSTDYLRGQRDIGGETATEMLSGSPALQEQMAGFARAGISFFFATKNFWSSIRLSGSRGAETAR